MESVIATVSGYHGAERFDLIKLIDHAGASYVGAMSSSITHLVFWKFEGRKYDIAMRSGTVVVNHRWIEDCVKLGMRVPEGPYTLQSGEEVGPLLLEVPVKNQKVLSDKTNARDGFSENRSGRMGCETSGDLFNENWFPGPKRHDCYRKSKGKLVKGTAEKEMRGPKRHDCYRKSKGKLVKGTAEKELRSSSRLSLQESPLHRSHRNPIVYSFGSYEKHVESSSHSSMDLARDKRKTFSDNGSDKAESSHKGRRRLVKKSKKREMVELLTSDSDQECYPSKVNSLSDDAVVVLSDHVNGPVDDIASNNRRHASLITDSPNRVSSSMDANDRAQNALTAPETISEDMCSGADNSKLKTAEEFEIRNDSDITSSTELSCVICWTDFSSSRGVLQCGHRFCYSCIENWADHMASRRKISTCPLCKTSFREILKFEDPATDDQKIYSQTIPCGLSKMNMFFLPDQETRNLSAQSETRPVCSVCCSLEPEDLLVACNLCRIRRIHSYCLDPPIDPWTCSDCKELQRLYLLSR